MSGRYPNQFNRAIALARRNGFSDSHWPSASDGAGAAADMVYNLPDITLVPGSLLNGTGRQLDANYAPACATNAEAA